MAKVIRIDPTDKKYFNTIKKFKIFEKLTPQELQEVLAPDESSKDAGPDQFSTIRFYKAGETVIREGDLESCSYWVVTGRFQVIQNGKAVAAFSRAGEIFGEMSLIDGCARTASIVCETDCVCLCMEMTLLDRIGNEKIKKKIQEAFYQIMTRRLAKTRERVTEEQKRLEMKYAYFSDMEKRIRQKLERQQGQSPS